MFQVFKSRCEQFRIISFDEVKQAELLRVRSRIGDKTDA